MSRSGLIFLVCILGAVSLGMRYGKYVLPSLRLPTIAFVGFIGVWIQQRYLPLATILSWVGSPKSWVAQANSRSAIMSIIGISYIEFELMHFYVDWKTGLIEKFSLLEFMCWMTFVPSIVAGPMQRFDNWVFNRERVEIDLEDIKVSIELE